MIKEELFKLAATLAIALVLLYLANRLANLADMVQELNEQLASSGGQPPLSFKNVLMPQGTASVKSISTIKRQRAIGPKMKFLAKIVKLVKLYQ